MNEAVEDEMKIEEQKELIEAGLDNLNFFLGPWPKNPKIFCQKKPRQAPPRILK